MSMYGVLSYNSEETLYSAQNHIQVLGAGFAGGVTEILFRIDDVPVARMTVGGLGLGFVAADGNFNWRSS